jgi:hypothetical protein
MSLNERSGLLAPTRSAMESMTTTLPAPCSVRRSPSASGTPFLSCDCPSSETFVVLSAYHSRGTGLSWKNSGERSWKSTLPMLSSTISSSMASDISRSTCPASEVNEM